MKPQDVYQEVNNLLFHELKSLGKVSTGNNQPWNGQEFTYWNWAKENIPNNVWMLTLRTHESSRKESVYEEETEIWLLISKGKRLEREKISESHAYRINIESSATVSLIPESQEKTAQIFIQLWIGC